MSIRAKTVKSLTSFATDLTHGMPRFVGVLIGCFFSVAASSRPEQCLIAATSKSADSAPVAEVNGQHLFRNAKGRWAPLPNVRETGETVVFTLSPEQLLEGKTVVLINKPKWLVLDNCRPPRMTNVRVDGRQVAIPRGSSSSFDLNLGWLAAPPRTIELAVADSQNPLDRDSIQVSVKGRTVYAGMPGLRFLPDPKDKRKGRIVCSLPELGVTDAASSNRIVVDCNDFAPDSTGCQVTFIFTVMRLSEIDLSKTPAATVNGIRLYVDSIYPGYENVECLLDGRLQTPDETTYGSTWASAEEDAAHWICLVLSKPRVVSGIEISWANYQNTSWTSGSYAIMTWDGQQWRNVLLVRKNPETQTSIHSFAPRTTDRVLVWVPPGGNHPKRPDLMWVSEVKLLPE